MVRLLAHRTRNLDGLIGSFAEEFAAPSPALLRRLSPVLGLHTADLFVIAGLPVPDDLAPVDPAAGTWVPQIARNVLRLAPEERRRVRDLVRSLPPGERVPPVPVPEYERYPPGVAGGAIAGMLRNRNLTWTRAARTLAMLTGRFLPAAAIGAVGHGRKELTPGLVTDFAILLGAPDLLVVAGFPPPARQLPDADVAALIWELRNLTAEQAKYISGVTAG